ncbi:MAG TPA: two-component regulator propeller domain-containing protein [Verrucomicrobiae bacterium]|nr:two-component regulator propeller domain-containing protein [Verrucomicrobiae bacterium]
MPSFVPAFRTCLIAALLMQSHSGFALEPIKLEKYPQKTRTFFELGDARAPSALKFESNPLPTGAVTALARASDGAVWLGTTQGVMRIDGSAPEKDRRQYLAGRRYLPDDQVKQLAPDEHGGMWIRTATGISHLELRAMTLEEKAALFEERIRARHDRYGLVADCLLTRAGDPASHQYIDNDNDGLWTSIYAAAECFRYQVTRSPQALAYARKSIEAMLFLEQVAGSRGFPARSYIRKGDRMPQGGEWHWTSDGQYYWKGDTSSDEIVGHFFMFSVAYDLLPDPELKQRIRQTAKRIMDHILDHQYNLVDLDGQPTTWGWWGPEKLTHQPDERALNSLQLLSFLKTASHITGEPRYDAEYRKAAWDFKYADWLTRVNEYREELNYSDEELAMLPFYCVFRYEKDPALLRAYRQGLDEWWKNIRREGCPLWTFIYLTGQPQAEVDLATAVWTLYRTPMDMIKWTVRNSQRQDITWAPGVERSGQREILALLAPDERPIMRWNSNPFVVDGGSDGQEEDDGAAFLLPYWMGRYHKFLRGK